VRWYLQLPEKLHVATVPTSNHLRHVRGRAENGVHSGSTRGIVPAPAGFNKTMASAHEYPHHHIRTERRITPPGSEFEDNPSSLDASFEQQPRCDFNTRYHLATETNPDSDEDRGTRDLSNRRIVSTNPNTILEDALTPSQVKRGPSSFTTKISQPSHHDLQDETFGLFSHIRPIDEHLDCDSRRVKSAPATRDKFHPSEECPTRRNFSTSRLTWLNGTLIFICTVSTALSAIFVFLALKGQRYGSHIGNESGAKMSIATAILWTSIAAKTIELSSVTGFVTLLGQVISRRAFVDSSSQGVTLSELTMWRWVVQPGTLVTQPEIAKYAGLSFLGILTLLSTILSTLYVTAATALVQPIPKQSHWNNKTMVGLVSSDFAFLKYSERCRAPIFNDRMSKISCDLIDETGKNYYNLVTFLSNWNEMVESNNSAPIDQRQRPSWIGVPYANATVVPQWIDIANTTEVSEKYHRVVTDVSLAMPHIGVANAVRDQRNSMPQSDTSGSVRAYSLWASVPSPVMKVLCTNLNATELAPIVYDTWNSEQVNASTWYDLGLDTTTSNRTVVDDLFGWNKKTETQVDHPPVFPQYPMPLKTFLSSVRGRRAAIYLLGQGAPKYDGKNHTSEYSLCKLEVGISPHCSTLYSVAVSGNKIEAVCEDQAGDMAYIRTNPNAQTVQSVPNWRYVGLDWAETLSLNSGMIESNNSFPRVLMTLQQSKIQGPSLSQRIPSLAETLAVSAGYTLLASWQDAPFVNEWVSISCRHIRF
jgi:hypothetical protein